MLLLTIYQPLIQLREQLRQIYPELAALPDDQLRAFAVSIFLFHVSSKFLC